MRVCQSSVKWVGLKIQWVSPCAGSNPVTRIYDFSLIKFKNKNIKS